MYCTKEKSIYFYHSTDGLICVVPCPRFSGVRLDKDGKPFSVIYPNGKHPEVGYPFNFYRDLKGLNVSDYSDLQPALVVYELGDGSLLAADADVFAKATLGSNNASSTGEACYVHLVKDLMLLEHFPIHTATGKHGLVAFEF